MPEMTAAEIAQFVAQTHGPDWLPHARMRASTVAAIEHAGFELRQSPPQPGHYDVVLPGPVTSDVSDILEGCFGPPESNPIARKRDDGG
jgi:hypothetical protein